MPNMPSATSGLFDFFYPGGYGSGRGQGLFGMDPLAYQIAQHRDAMASPELQGISLRDRMRYGPPGPIQDAALGFAGTTIGKMSGGLLARAEQKVKDRLLRDIRDPQGITDIAGPSTKPKGTGEIYDAGLPQFSAKRAEAEATGKWPMGTKTTEQFYQPGMDEAGLLAAAQRGEHLNPSKKGGIFGAPNTFTSAEDIARQRAISDAYAETGAAQRGWYDEGQQAIKDYSPTPEAGEGLAQGMSLMSPNNSPRGATNSTIQMHNRLALTGERQTHGLPENANNYLSSFDAAGTPGGADKGLFGNKTGPFGNQLGAYGKEGLNDPRTVNDLWRGRAQGYPAGPTEGTFKGAQHNYMWGEGVLSADRARRTALAGATDWSPRSFQAAEWVGKRAEEPLAKRAADVERIMAGPGDEAAKQAAIAALPTRQQILEAANESVRSTLERNATNVNWEVIPGSGLGHRQDLLAAPAAERTAYSQPREQLFRNPASGHDRLYQSAGLYQRPMREAVGEYRAPDGTMTNDRAVVSGPVFSSQGQAGGHAMQPFEQQFLDRTEKLRGGLLAQHAVGYNRAATVPEGSAATTGLLYRGGDPAGATARLKEAGVDTINNGAGEVLATRFGPPLKPGEVAKARAAAGLRDTTTPVMVNSGLVETGGTGKPGSVTAGILEAFKGPGGARQAGLLDQEAMPIARQLMQMDAGHPGASPAYQALRQTIGDQGVTGLMQATKGMSKTAIRAWAAKRGLPAVTLAALLAGASEE